MNLLLENIWIGLGTGLVAGLVTGMYSGLIVSRVMRFNSLRSEALRAFNSVEYIYNSDNQLKVKRNNLPSTALIAAEFFHFGHKAAGECLLLHVRNVEFAMLAAENGQGPYEDFESALSESQKAIRAIAPSKRILIPYGKI